MQFCSSYQVYMEQFSKILLLLFFSTTVFAQGVCDTKTGVETGGFTFDGPSTVCIGQTVKLKDNSGGTGIKYVFGYLDTEASKLSSISSTTTPEWAFLAPGQYTVLQYGKKNGKDMYYCDVVRVRADNQPKISYYSCNNDRVNITIPNDIINDFDYYKINWGDGNSPETVNKNQLPYNKSKNLSLPKTIKVEGFFNSGTIACPSPNSITLPSLAPSSFPLGFTQPFYPNIEKIELIIAQTAKLDIKGSFQDNGYDIYMTQQGSSYPSTPIAKNIMPGTFNINIPDTTKSYCFYIQKPIVCGIEQSAEICTLVLNSVEASNKDDIILWDEYPTSMTGISNTTIYGRYLNRNQTIQKKENGVLKSPIQADGLGGVYKDAVDCSKKYCYQVISETQGQIYYNSFKGKSISKEICIDRKNVFPDPITDVLVTVTNDNFSAITFSDNSPWSLKRDKYILYRQNDAIFEKIDSNIVVSSFLDNKVDGSQKANCYKISFVDECGSNSLLSPRFCTINLTENPNLTLQWTNQSPFGSNAISQFEVQSYDEQTDLPSTDVIKMPTETTYEVILDNFEVEAKYRIRITSANGKESFSNTYSIPISVKLFLPDTFSPNNDSINDNLVIKGSTKRITTFELQIYNRWGNPVFSSTNPSDIWDGQYQNNIAPSDTYTYKIYAKLDDGKELNKSGKILLLR